MLPLRKLRVSRGNALAWSKNPKLPEELRQKAHEVVEKIDRAIEAHKVMMRNDLKSAQAILSGEIKP